MKVFAGLLLVVMLGVAVQATDYEYKVYFGLSKQGGAVSLAEWEQYEADFAKHFTGFTVTSAVGFYQGTKERSRVITLLMDECREPLLTREIRKYAVRFSQDSVLMSKTALVKAELVGTNSIQSLNDTCKAA